MQRNLITRLLLIMSGLLLASTCIADESENVKGPNILWIVGKNLKLDLGCYGAANVKTLVYTFL